MITFDNGEGMPAASADAYETLLNWEHELRGYPDVPLAMNDGFVQYGGDNGALVMYLPLPSDWYDVQELTEYDAFDMDSPECSCGIPGHSESECTYTTGENHDFTVAPITGAVTCARCGLLPLDIDDVNTECTVRTTEGVMFYPDDLTDHHAADCGCVDCSI